MHLSPRRSATRTSISCSCSAPIATHTRAPGDAAIADEVGCRGVEKKPLTVDEISQIEAMNRSAIDGTMYAVLGVPIGTLADEVEKAYHDIARRFHPDRFYSRDVGIHAAMIEENFVAATRAYRTLRDVNKRSAYDRELRDSGRMPKVSAAPAPPAPPEPAKPAHEARFTPRSSMPPPPPPPPPETPKPRAPSAVDKIKQQLSGQFSRAKSYYDAGKADFDAGNFAKAESALYLAVQFDPKNASFQDLLQRAVACAAEVRVKGWIVEAERLEQYGKQKEALALYKKAAEAEAPEGRVYFRLATLVKECDDDARAALQMFRKAVQKEPKQVKYRLALAEQYFALGLRQNALREAQAVLELDPKNEVARALAKKLR